MKRFRFMLVLLMGAAMVFAFAACGSSDEGSAVDVDYGTSDIYSQEDMDAAITVIEDEFATWEGCELQSIAYAGDECNSDENIAWMNELGEAQEVGETFDQCIEFTMNFHSPVEEDEPTAWELDTDYTDYQWWLARSEGGDWRVLTTGY